MTPKLPTSYRPENVRVEKRTDSPYGPRCPFVVVDHDGTDLQWFSNESDAEAHRNSRAGVIKATLTRRARKAAAR